MPSRVFALAASLILSLTPLIAQPPTPTALVSEQGLEISGVTPGDEVLILGFARIARGYYSTLERTEEVLFDDDGDGAVLFAPDDGIALRSIWAAVDLASGEYAVAVSEGFALRPAPAEALVLPAVPAELPEPAEPHRLLSDRRFLELWLLRPPPPGGATPPAPGEPPPEPVKTRAWVLSGAEGGTTDDDGESDGVLTLSLPSMRPIGPTIDPAPEQLAGMDLLLGVDPQALDWIEIRVVGPPPGTEPPAEASKLALRRAAGKGGAR